MWLYMISGTICYCISLLNRNMCYSNYQLIGFNAIGVFANNLGLELTVDRLIKPQQLIDLSSYTKYSWQGLTLVDGG